jgi:hypothetical protein
MSIKRVLPLANSPIMSIFPRNCLENTVAQLREQQHFHPKVSKNLRGHCYSQNYSYDRRQWAPTYYQDTQYYSGKNKFRGKLQRVVKPLLTIGIGSPRPDWLNISIKKQPFWPIISKGTTLKPSHPLRISTLNLVLQFQDQPRRPEVTTIAWK